MSIQQQISQKILLVGDSCLDYYHFGTCERISPEAPVPVIKQTKIEVRDGMSLNVKNNLESFGLTVTHLTNEKMIEKRRIVDMKSNYQICRLDVNESNALDQIDTRYVDSSSYDCLVISDYNKGVVSEDVVKHLCDAFKNKPIFVDSKKKDLSIFENCIIKINESEFKSSNSLPVNSEIIVTMGSKGALYNSKIYETNKVEVFDVCGAGDVFLSALVFCFLKTKSLETSIRYANNLASRSVTKMGTYVLTEEDINDFCI